MIRHRRRQVRRGVLLLVVLALLTIFAIVLLAFVATASLERRIASRSAGDERIFDPPDRLLEQAALQVLRGTDDSRSVLRPHSLLEDLYGNGSFAGTISDSPQPIAGGQLLEFSIPDLPHRIGCVLTMQGGPTAGESTRIVGYGPTSHRGQVLAMPSGRLPMRGDRYLINGTPFSGTGAGFNPDSTSGAMLDAVDPHGWPYALLPNPAAFEANSSTGYGDPAGPGGMNSDYDAPDYQNMLLAAKMPDGTVSIPSLHRPDLVRYWMRREPAAWNSVDALLRRKVILRPLADDNPNFTGSNPNFDPVNGPWDVDNDGDGRPDSIWVDLGMPVRYTREGRPYKPLFAILCVDLDGRLNLNAHGCLAQGTWDYYLGAQSPHPALQFAGTTVATDRVALLRGGGWGAAEVNLNALFSPNPGPSVEFWQLLTGRVIATDQGATTIDGRYGKSNLLPDGKYVPAPGFTTANGSDPQPSAAQYLSRNRFFDFPDNFYDFSVPTSYGTPPDLKGSLSVGVDLGGQPLYPLLSDPGVGSPFVPYRFAATNHPYELDLSREAGRSHASPAEGDNPFSLGELERLLRRFDCDAPQLPTRLESLAPSLGGRAHVVTTESADLPCPTVVLPPALRNRGLRSNRAVHLVDLLKAKGVDVADIGKLALLLPQEFLAGLRMDLNRPLGNGHDDNGNGVVDEPGDLPANGGKTLDLVKSDGAPDRWPCDIDNNGQLTHDGLAARQAYARNLYVLMMLVVDDDALPSWADPTWDTPRRSEEHARWLAQWAVNVVDFRDRDSIMTPFDYDPLPFANGGQWKPPADGRHTVWGCERPELVITETIAFHDRRTEDLDTEAFDPADGTADHTEAGKTSDNSPRHDPTFDQRLKPEGSLFVELYNPWLNHCTPMVEPPPKELYASDGEGNYGLDLARVATVGGVSSPVWRMVVTMGVDSTKDLDDPFETDPPRIERAIYFVKQTSAGAVTLPGDGQIQFYPSARYQSMIKPLLGGQYAVIGPDSGDSGTAITYLGFRRDGKPSRDPDKNPLVGNDQTRQIVLHPGAVPAVTVLNNGADYSGLPDNIRPPLAVVINRCTVADKAGQYRRLSVSEPADGYPDADPDGVPYDPDTGYKKPYDLPLDKRLNASLYEQLKDTSTTANFCTVYMQRLANPLVPFDAASNPYRTVDKMPVDLTAFNGVSTDPDPEDMGNPNPPPPTGPSQPTTVQFSTRERGQSPTGGANNLWRQEFDNGAPQGHQDTSTDEVFAWNLHHSIGYLNRAYGPRLTYPVRYLGCPARTPFPWLTWHNRPFASNLELLLVPATRSSQLLGLYGMRAGSSNPYNSLGVPHLLDFFQTPAGLVRVLDLVHVPSRFAKSELAGNPARFSEDATSGAPTHNFHPPLNRISAYRETGRVNLNTIYSRDILRALLNRTDLGDDGLWDKFVRSRSGSAAAGQLPTAIARPFRSAASFGLVPLPELAASAGSEVDCTLLRQNPDEPGRPLFDYASTAPASDTSRNPYFANQYFERLGNLTTTRSNIYAVWITVGYFEAEPATNRKMHPDGFQLGQELGADTGDTSRHRAFYIFDRSIPVGFQRGADLNVSKAIVLRRFIE